MFNPNPIKKYRILRGLTQVELSVQTSIPRFRLSLFETFQTKPTQDEVEKLALALGVSTKQLSI